MGSAVREVTGPLLAERLLELALGRTVGVMQSLTESVRDVGGFIREQRETAKVSLRELARTAGVSNPYLSQIERGLRKPSAEILAQIAKGLQISAESLYQQAGLLEERPGDVQVATAIRLDTHLSERHKQVLLELYDTFCREHNQTTTSAATPPNTAATPLTTTDQLPEEGTA